MNELQKLYDELYSRGKYTKSFEEFQIQFGDEAYREKVFSVVTRDGLFKQDKNAFDQIYATDVLKKKAPSTSLQLLPGESPTTASSAEGGSLASQEGNKFDPKDFMQRQPMAVADATFLAKPIDKVAASKSIAETAKRKAETARLLNIQKVQDAQKKKEDEARVKSAAVGITKTPEFQNKLKIVNDKLIDQDEDTVVDKMNTEFGRNGFTFEKTGIGDAMIVRSFDGKHTLKVDLDPFTNATEVAESAKLRQFLSAYAQEDFKINNEDFLSQAYKAQNLRTVGRLNPDGTESTVKMTSFEEDGKYYAIPTLFPKNPNSYNTSASTWQELPFDQALKVARERGELFQFKTDQEAKDFANGSWKDVSTRDIEADKFYKERGLDYITEKKRYDKYKELDDIIDFVEGNNEEGKEGLKKTNPELFINGRLREDADEYIKEIKKQRDALEPVVKDYGFFSDGKSEVARMDWDAKLAEREKEIAAQAIKINNEAKAIAYQLDAKAIETFGVSAKDLLKYKNTDPNTQAEFDAITKEYYSVQQLQKEAATKFEIAKTYFDGKADKQVNGEFKENLRGFWNAASDAYNQGQIGEQLLSFAMPGGKDVSSFADRKEAAEYIAKQYADMYNTEDRAMARWRNARGFQEGLDVIFDDPLELVTTMAASSMSQMLPYGLKIIAASIATGAATGAGLGSVGLAPGVVAGGITGSIYGARTGFALTNLASEYVNAVMASVEKNGYNPMDPESLAAALGNENVWKDGRETGLVRGIPIAAVDFLTAGLAGRVFKPASALASRSSKIIRGTAERFVVDPVGEALGELAAQGSEVMLGTGREKIGWKEIAEESMGGIGSNTFNWGMNSYKDLRDKNNIDIANSLTNISNISSESASDEKISSWVNNMLQLKKIDADVAQRINVNVGLRREARELLEVGTNKNKNSEAVNRTMELLAAKTELSSSQNRREIYRSKIQDINAELAIIGETKKTLPVDKAVDLSTIIGATRQGTSQYSIDGRRFTKEQFIEKVNALPDEQLGRVVLGVKNDTETGALVKARYNAIQGIVEGTEQSETGAAARSRILSTVQETLVALNQLPEEEKAALTFTNEAGEQVQLNENEEVVAQLYHDAIAVPEEQRTPAQKSAVDTITMSLKAQLDAEQSMATQEVTQPENVVMGRGVSVTNKSALSALEGKSKGSNKVIISAARKAITTLQSIFPEMDIFIHEDANSYNEAMGSVNVKGVKNSAGNFSYESDAMNNPTGRGRIDINLSMANARTVAHEVAHAIMLKKFGENPALFKSFRDKIAKILNESSNKTLMDFANQYVDKQGNLLDVTYEEYLAELTGALAAEQGKISATTLQKIAALINEIVSKLTNGSLKPFEDIKDTNQVIDFFNNISNSIREGKEVKNTSNKITVKADNKGFKSRSQAVNKASAVKDIDVNSIRMLSRAGKRVSKGLSVKTVNKKKVVSEAEDLSIDYVKENAPKIYISNAKIIAAYPIVQGIKKIKSVKTIDEAQEVYDIFVRQVANNLKYLIDNFNDEFREISTLWYDGANILAQNFSEKYDVSEEQAAGIIAAMSPQKDWYQNVRLAEMVMMAFKENPVMTKEMIDKQILINIQGLKLSNRDLKSAQKAYSLSRTKSNKEKLDSAKKELQEKTEKGDKIIEYLKSFVGKKMNSVPNEFKCYYTRLWNEINTTKDYDVLRPDSKVMGVAMNKDGVTKSKVAWGSYTEIGKAVSIYIDGSQENITKSLGEMHKIRNFFNNIIDPMSEDKDVTMDTHAIAAALLMPLSGKAKQVAQNFGTGTSNSSPLGIKGLYYAYAEGYNMAAEENNLLPRQVQSITWEAVRGLFTDVFKGKTENVRKINEIWDEYTKSKININEARNKISEYAGGIKDPTWAVPFQEEFGNNVESGDIGGRGNGNGPSAVGKSSTDRGGKFTSKSQQSARRIENQDAINSRAEKRTDELSKALETNANRSRRTRGVNKRDIRRTERLRGNDVNIIAEYTFDNEIDNGIKKAFPLFQGVQKVYEITNGDVYRKLMIEGLQSNRFAASVTIHTPEDFNGMKMFVTEDGSTGITLTKEGFLGGAFSSTERPNNLSQLMVLGIKEGATTAECFDTVLPDYYANFGFKGVSRTAFNEEFKPMISNGNTIKDWDFETYKKYNEGKPDVVFLIYDGGDRNTIEERLGQFDLYTTYEKENTQSFNKDEYDSAEAVMKQMAIKTIEHYEEQEGNIKSKSQEVGQGLSEADLPGYDSMMDKVEAIIKKVLKERGGTKLRAFKAALDYMQQDSTTYANATNVQQEALVRQLRKEFGIREKSAPNVGRLLGVIQDIKKITMSEKDALKKQLKDYQRGAKDVKKALAKASTDLSKAIKEMEASGKLTTNQVANVLRKFSKVDLFNEDSVDNFVEYMANVFADAEYSEKMSKIRGKLPTARKNVRTKLGAATNLIPAMEKLFAINPNFIPSSVLDSYILLVDMMGARQDTLDLMEINVATRMTNAILDAVDNEQSKAEELSDRFDWYSDPVLNDDGSINFAETIKAMVKDGTVTEEEAELMRKYKNIIMPRPEAVQKTEQEIEDERAELSDILENMSVDPSQMASLDDRRKAGILKSLLRTEAIQRLSVKQLNNLIKVVNAINNGYFPHSAQLALERLNAINNAIELVEAVREAKPIGKMPLTNLYTRLKRLLSNKNNTAIDLMVLRSPLFFIDQVFGDFKTKRLFNAVFSEAAKGQAAFEAQTKIINQKIEKVRNSISKSPDETLMSSYRMMTYMIQNEFLSNPNSDQVNPAHKYLAATIKYLDSNNQDDQANMLQSILDNYTDPADGSIDINKLYRSFSKKERAALKVMREINDSMTERAVHTAGVIRGQRISPLANYVHMPVMMEFDTQNTTSVTAAADAYNRALMPSTKGKSLIERDGKVHPLNFNIFSSVEQGSKSVLMDYHLTEAVRTARKTLAEAQKMMAEGGRVSKEKRQIFGAIKKAFNVATENLLLNNYMTTSWGDEAIDFISRQGYRAILASVPRFFAELLSNISAAVISFPKSFAAGLTHASFIMTPGAIDVVNNVRSKQIGRLFSGDMLSGRFIDSSILNQKSGIRAGEPKGKIRNAAETLYNRTLKKYKNAVELTADSLISTPDKMVMRPIWFGAFATKFESMTGRKVDFERIAANDESYMEQYKDAIEAATNSADEKSVLSGATNNAYMGILKGKSPTQSMSSKIFNNFNNFMTTFAMYEYTAARTGLYASVGNGTMSRREGAALLAGVTTRMVVYSMLTKMLGETMLSVFRDEPEEEEDEEKTFMQKFGQALTSAVTGMLFGRDFGNATRTVVNVGLEEINKNFLTGLRNGEYDPYKDAIAYSALPKEKKGQQANALDYVMILAGSMGPMAKTVELGIKKYTEEPKKEEGAIQRQKDEIEKRLPLEIAGNLGFIPLYKDIRKVLMDNIYASLKQEMADEKNNKARKEAETYLKNSEKIKALQQIKSNTVDQNLRNEMQKQIDVLSLSPEKKKAYDEDNKAKEDLKDAEYEALLQGYENQTQMKNADKPLWERTFGPNSSYYKENYEEKKVKSMLENKMNFGDLNDEEEAPQGRMLYKRKGIAEGQGRNFKRTNPRRKGRWD